MVFVLYCKVFFVRVGFYERVTKIENIKTDSPKILRPTRFLGPKDINTDLTDWPVSNWRIRPKI
jgi:hypothetical protein